MLRDRMLTERIERLSLYIESSGKHYKSHAATIRAWAARDKTAPRYQKPAPIYGGTGELGTAELEAIQRLMQGK